MNDSEIYISDEAVIKNKDIHDVYERCIEWIKKSRARIVEEEPPKYLKAERYIEYQGYMTISNSIMIDLEPCEDGVRIRVKIPKVLVTRLMPLLEYQNGKLIEIIEDFYQHAGVNIDRPLLRRIYPRECLDAMLRGSLFFSILTASLCLLTVYVSINYFSGITSALFLLLGLTGFYTFSYPRLKEFMRANKKRRILYSAQP